MTRPSNPIDVWKERVFSGFKTNETILPLFLAKKESAQMLHHPEEHSILDFRRMVFKVI
jgi:hypothetical protein